MTKFTTNTAVAAVVADVALSTVPVVAINTSDLPVLTTADLPALNTAALEITEFERPSASLILAAPAPSSIRQPKAFYVASQWHITPAEQPCEDGWIDAVNNTTGDRYNGSIAEFNEMLRGD